jgi:hypothetical protein
MTLEYAIVNEQGCTFTVVLVQKTVLKNHAIAEQAIHWLQTRHFHMPTALMARDEYGVPNAYYGPGDLALVLARIPPGALPWQESAIA